LNSEKIWKMWKKSELNSEKIGKIWMKSELNSEKIGKIWKKSELNSEKIGKIWKKSLSWIIKLISLNKLICFSCISSYLFKKKYIQNWDTKFKGYKIWRNDIIFFW
jgi:hypothetical protein